MPRYKVNEKTYNLPENKVEGFLIKFPDAILIEDEPQDFPTSTAADADVVQQPMTASQAGYVEPKDTELPSVDTSLDLPSSQFNSIVKAFGGNPEAIEKAKMSRAQLDEFSTLMEEVTKGVNTIPEKEKTTTEKILEPIVDVGTRLAGATFNIPTQLESAFGKVLKQVSWTGYLQLQVKMLLTF